MYAYIYVQTFIYTYTQVGRGWKKRCVRGVRGGLSGHIQLLTSDDPNHYFTHAQTILTWDTFRMENGGVIQHYKTQM